MWFRYNEGMETEASTRSYRWLLWVVAVVVWVADQLTKTLVIQNLAIGETWRPYAGRPWLELFALSHTKNSGAAFGMLPDASLFFILVAVVVSLGIVWYYPRLDPRRAWLFLSLGLMLGGALGNLTDRLRIGWVTDFIHIGSFAIFNIADSSVFLGVTLLAFQMWRDDEAKRREDEAAKPPSAPPALRDASVADALLQQRGGARVYGRPARGPGGGARSYDTHYGNGRAQLEQTSVVWGNERASDDGRE